MTCSKCKNAILDKQDTQHIEEAYTKEIELQNILIRMRAEASLNQKEVAAILEITPSAVSRLENRTIYANINSLQRYANACGFRLYFYYK